MQKIEYFTYIYYSVFSVPEEVKLSSTHYLIMKIYNKRELKQISISRSPYVDYKSFINI